MRVVFFIIPKEV